MKNDRRSFPLKGGLKLRKRDYVTGQPLFVHADCIIQATNNWWGDAVTAEMNKQGNEANSSAFEDCHDQATLEFRGGFRRDCFAYAPWQLQPLKDVGPQDPGQSNPSL